MSNDFLLNKTLVKKIAKATDALLILQWGYFNSVWEDWNVTDPQRCRKGRQLTYHIAIVVKDDQPLSSIELTNACRRFCNELVRLSPDVYFRKEALRRIKSNTGHFAIVHRLGYVLHNADKNTFPSPGYARKLQRMNAQTGKV